MSPNMDNGENNLYQDNSHVHYGGGGQQVNYGYGQYDHGVDAGGQYTGAPLYADRDQFYTVGQAGGGWPGQPGVQINLGGSQLPLDPMVTNMAMSYGADMVNQKKKEVEGIVEKYFSLRQLKYYFAVDNNYVSRKLRLLMFPFIHSDWSIKYNHDEPVQPRFELNAADLYIPSMAFVTYILVVGYMLGLQDRFSPEVLAATASSALTALVLEVLLIYLATTIMSVKSTLAKWDYLAFAMYKYVGMIWSLLAGLLLSSRVYYPVLLYMSAALLLFLSRTLHHRVEPEVHGVEKHGKRKLWLFLMVGWQPLVMWWLTYSLVPYANDVNLGGADF